MTLPRPALALPILAGLAMMSVPAAAQQQQLYGGSGYGSSVVGAYNPYTQAGPRSTQGRAYGAAPVAPYPPAYGAVTAQSPVARPDAAPGGPRVPYAQPPSGQVGAYNPWRPQPVGGYSPATGSRPPAFYAPYGPYTDADPGANLPPPPPGPIRSRLLSIPEAGNPQGAPAPFQSVPYVPRRSGAVRPPAAPRTTVAAATPAAPQIANGGATDSPPPPPTPTPRVTNPPRSAAPAKPAPPPAPVAAAPPPEPVKPAPPPAPVVAAKPPEPPKPAPAVIVERPTQMAAAPPPAPTPPKPAATGATRVVFDSNSPALSPDARAALDRLAADLIATPSRKTTLKAYSAGGTGPDTRRLSLARGLAVRAYLIDKGVPRERLDVQALGASADGGPVDRVDVVAGAGT